MSLLSVDITKVKRLSLLPEEPQGKTPPRSPLQPSVEASSPVDISRLDSIASGLLRGQNHYPKKVIIQLLQETLKVTPDRAEKGFNMMLQTGAFKITSAGTYYLRDSTPF